VRVVALVLLTVVAAGCGTKKAAPPVHHPAKRPAQTSTAGDLPVGVVGNVSFVVPGAVMDRGSLTQVAHDSLVLVDASSPAASQVPLVASSYPTTTFALVGASARDLHLHNVEGLVLRDDEAAHVMGLVAGLIASDVGAQQPRVGWAGPQEIPLANAFADGVHAVDRSAQILHSWSTSVPASCKEAALALIARGAVAVAAHRGICAGAVASGAHEQDVVALRLTDFEFPDAAAAAIVRDALSGIDHGGHDVIFGYSTGAIGVGALDRRISSDTAIRARQLVGQLIGSSQTQG